MVRERISLHWYENLILRSINNTYGRHRLNFTDFLMPVFLFQLSGTIQYLNEYELLYESILSITLYWMNTNYSIPSITLNKSLKWMNNVQIWTHSQATQLTRRRRMNETGRDNLHQVNSALRRRARDQLSQVPSPT